MTIDRSASPAVALLALAIAMPLGAQTPAPAPIVYPAKNQSAEQQAKDKSECDAWAKQNTGIDPAAVAAEPASAAPAPAAKSEP